MEVISTDRLILKNYTASDEVAMIELLTNEVIKETFMIPDLPTIKEQKAMFLKLLAWSQSDEHLELGIYLDGQLIGFINDVMKERDAIELGIVIHPRFHGRGFATEALSATIKYLFAKGYKEVIAGAFDHNMASIRVLQKCGMKPMDKKDKIKYRDHVYDCSYFSISR